MSNIKILPFYLVRKGGLNFEEVVNSFCSDLDTKFGNLKFCEAKLKTTQERLISVIFDYLRAVEDDQNRKKLLNLKRDVFNNRKIIKYQNFINTLENPLLSECFNNYLENVNDSVRHFDELTSLFSKSTTEFKKSLKDKFNYEPFKRSIMLSSFALYSNLKAYLAGDYDNHDKKRLHVEQGLMRYYFRMATKTSPYAWFTSVSLNYFSDLNEYKGSKNIGHPNINVNILRFILIVLKRYNCFKESCPIRINSSSTFWNGTYSFIQNISNQTIIHELEENELVDHIVRTLNSTSNFSLASLRESIFSEFDFEENHEAIDEYINELQTKEFIVFDPGISMNDSLWIKDLQSFLSKFENKSELISDVINLLDGFYSLLSLFSDSSCDKRESLLKINFKALVLFAEKWTNEMRNYNQMVENFDFNRSYSYMNHSFKIEVLLFEDVKGQTKGNLTLDLATEIAANLNLLFVELDSVQGEFKVTEPIKLLLHEEFNDEATKIIPFFNKYWLKYAKNDEIIFPQNSEDESNYVRNLLNKCMRHDSINNCVFIETKETQPNRIASKLQSYNCFVQVYYDKVDKRQKGIINQLTPGFGKMFSRFLYMFPQEAIDILAQHNYSLIKGNQILVDNIEGIYFNANCHPSIFKNEVTQPDYQNFISKTGGINLSEFTVERDGERVIVKNSGNECFFIDLGFQVISIHSTFFNFLNHFSLTKSTHNHSPIVKAVNDHFNGEIRILPRIVFNNIIVLQRKTWIVNSRSLPKIESFSSEAEFFIYLNSWRKNLGIPNEVFIRISYNRTEVVKNNDHKPFYLHFFNPVCITALTKALSKDYETIRISEMLPGSEDMINVDGGKYTCEYLFQWSTNE